MKLISWNVNGIRACAKKGLLEFLQLQDPDIFCLQETKAHPDQLDETLLYPFDYRGHWSSALKRGYSGTVTYLKRSQKDIQVDNGIGIRKFDSEGRFVVSEHPDFALYNVYFPNGGASLDRHNYKQDFLKKFLKHLKKRMDEGREIILCGDYNIAHKDIDVYDAKKLADVSGFLPEEREWFSGFLEAGFIDTFRYFYPQEKHRYTWWSYRERARIGNRGWRIDYVCITKGLEKRLKSAAILDEQMGSDHCPVVLELD